MAQPFECRILFFCFVLLLMGCTSGVRNSVKQDSEARDQAYVTGYGTDTVNDEKNGEVENSHKENPSYIARYGGAKKTNQPYIISYGKEKRKSQPYITGYRGDKEINQPYITEYQIEKGTPLDVTGYDEKKEINQPYITGYRGAKKRKQRIITSDGDAKETNQPYITGYRGQGETNQPYITGYRGRGKTNQPYITGYRSAKETKQLYITSYGADIEKNKPYIASYGPGAPEKTNKPYIIAYGDSKETKQPYVTSYGDAKETNQPYITTYGDAKKTNQPYIIAYGDAKETKQPYITSYGDTKKPDQPYIIAYGDAEKSNKHPYITQYHGNDKETSTNPKSKCTGHLHAGHNHMTGLENHMQTQPSTGVDHTEAFKIGFFTPDDLYLGKIMPLYFPIKDHSSRFLPREVADSIPFSMSQLPSLLQLFSVPQGSPEAKDMERTLQDCEHEPINGEIKSCATSLESMVEFARSIIGSEVNFKLLSTTHPTMAIDLAQNYTVSEAPKQVLAPKMVFCHPVPYPYAVFFCHFFGTETKVFQVTLHAESGDDVAAMAICHMDTSDWDPDHVLFSLLGVKPGTSSPVCHFLPKNHLVWIPSPTIATE